MTHEGLGDNTKISWQIQDQANWDGQFAFGRQISIISKEGFRLPPKAFLTPLSLRVELRPPFTERLFLKGNIGCAGSPTMNIEIENDSAEVERIYEEYFTQQNHGAVPKEFRHKIASDLLNVPEEAGSSLEI